jgi:hypothetical protein
MAISNYLYDMTEVQTKMITEKGLRFVVLASSPEAVRNEVVLWAKRLAADQRNRERIAKRQTAKSNHAAKAETYEFVAEFWKAVVIKPVDNS